MYLVFQIDYFANPTDLFSYLGSDSAFTIKWATLARAMEFDSLLRLLLAFLSFLLLGFFLWNILCNLRYFLESFQGCIVVYLSRFLFVALHNRNENILSLSYIFVNKFFKNIFPPPFSRWNFIVASRFAIVNIILSIFYI